MCDAAWGRKDESGGAIEQADGLSVNLLAGKDDGAMDIKPALQPGTRTVGT